MNQPVAIESAIVTGGTGLLGRKLLALLAEKCGRILVITHPGSHRNGYLTEIPGVEIEMCGLQGLSGLQPRGQWDAFFHLGWIGSESPAARHEVAKQIESIRYSMDAVDFAARSRCKVFVGAGSQAEYGILPDGVARIDSAVSPVEAYGVAKFAACRLTAIQCSQLGIRHCWGRILSVYGEHDRPITLVMYAIRCLLRGEMPRFTPCGQIRDYIYSGDCAAALWRMAVSGTDGAAYPLGGGTPRPLKEYIEEIRRQINPAAEMGYGAIPYPADMAMHVSADMEPLRCDTGYEPKTSFEDGIEAILRSLGPRTTIKDAEENSMPQN